MDALETDTEKERQIVSASVDELERLMLEMEQVECPVIHRFGEGIYLREAFLKAGTVVVGHRHKVACLNQMLYGKILVVSEGYQKALVGHNVFRGDTEERKAAYVLEDTLWQNIWENPDNEQDIETLEDRLIEKSEGFKMKMENMEKCLSSQ